MRKLRWLTTGLLALASMLVVSPGRAFAAAPTAPFDAFTLDGPSWNFAFDPSNATIGLTMFGPEGVHLSANSPAHQFNAYISAPTGQTLSVGTFSDGACP